ncbi:MAG: NADH azoreductase [Finegoldia magna]|nr:NADH azoreductase [Finegoldia magna]MDD6907037.1 NADH azoreductase [Finegoldia magna]
MIENNRKYLDFAKKTSLGLNTNMSSMTFASVDHFNERFSPLFGSRRIFKNRKNA